VRPTTIGRWQWLHLPSHCTGVGSITNCLPADAVAAAAALLQLHRMSRSNPLLLLLLLLLLLRHRMVCQMLLLELLLLLLLLRRMLCRMLLLPANPGAAAYVSPTPISHITRLSIAYRIPALRAAGPLHPPAPPVLCDNTCCT
jgi:hypothetical protein